ncbi:PGPGW domain-containing protein [bacterium]|nr:PGPGW domain-containing protein [candidate division CSSED10-310 bacterium]
MLQKFFQWLQAIALESYHRAHRIVVVISGGFVLLVGIAMIFLPGPAFIMIPLGLVILATEFVWARRLLNRLKKEIRGITGNFGSGNNPGQ